MATRYGIRHRGTMKWLATLPEFGGPLLTARDEERVTLSTEKEATIYANELGDGWDVAPVEVESIYDLPPAEANVDA